MAETIWVMDSEICEMCNGLLDWFGECPHCGWDACFGYPGENLEDDEWDPFWSDGDES